MAKSHDITSDDLPKGRSLGLGEIGTANGIECVSDRDFTTAAGLESFMQEPVTINVHESQADGALDVICITVNQLNQPIVRGVDTVVKRKYVEALARSRDTNWGQKMDPLEREKIQMIEKTTLAYPFSVIEDRNPNGRPWLKSILAER